MTFDMHAAMAAALVERGAAWEFVRGFAADRATAIEAGDGCDGAALDACEARLGLALPVAVRELYELLGRRGDLTSNQDVLLGPEKIYVEDGVLVFREENQGVCWWGVRLDDPSPDPAVIVRFDGAPPEGGEWFGWLPAFSVAAVEMVMSETVLFDDDLVDACDTSEVADEALEVLRAHVPSLAFPRYPDDDEDGGSLWFVSEDLLVRWDPGMATVRARTEEALDAIGELLPGEWIGM
ncbi:SMI1/KNR4 family protein [Streptomyces sp. SID3343]|uniref:SMI1/KNR4 family protein n=1 Tax=Streptomyces sp. SID3343 TaxID=2690260 RepID=UPI00136CA88A|nr:SMI1/KNR4 family protein [Streptomyces sp. SID3343]MYV99717.1 SMI1/KNR4 family protein [Streptomyces sp. SID3343]